MQLNEYQQQAMTTCMKTCDNFSYMILNLIGEVGEFSSKVAKAIRKGYLHIADNDPVGTFAYLSENNLNDELRKEAGDILWQISGLCHIFGWHLEDVAQENLDKLASRQQRGVIDGNGDNR